MVPAIVSNSWYSAGCFVCKSLVEQGTNRDKWINSRSNKSKASNRSLGILRMVNQYWIANASIMSAISFPFQGLCIISVRPNELNSELLLQQRFMNLLLNMSLTDSFNIWEFSKWVELCNLYYCNRIKLYIKMTS